MHAASTSPQYQPPRPPPGAPLVYVFRLRAEGKRLDPAVILERGPVRGLFAFQRDVMGPPTDYARLFAPDGAAVHPILQMHIATLVRDSRGCQLYSGFEWGLNQSPRQSWVVAPAAQRGAAIVRMMPANGKSPGTLSGTGAITDLGR